MGNREVIDVTFKMDGPLLKESIPVIEVITAIREFHFLIDKAYLTMKKLPRMSPKERQHYSIMATDFKKGSFEADLQIAVIAAAAQLWPGVSSLSPKELWEIAKNSYDFLKILFTMRGTGVEPKVRVEGDNNHVTVIEDSTIVINQTVYDAADRSEPHLKKLTSIIEPGQIDRITSLDNQGKGIVLTEKENKLFNPKTKIDKETITLKCDIIRFDKIAKKGKLHVFEGQGIPTGEYTFKPISSREVIGFILSMAKKVVTITALKEIEIHTTGVERIAALHVASIEEEPRLF